MRTCVLYVVAAWAPTLARQRWEAGKPPGPRLSQRISWLAVAAVGVGAVVLAGFGGVCVREAVAFGLPSGGNTTTTAGGGGGGGGGGMMANTTTAAGIMFDVRALRLCGSASRELLPAGERGWHHGLLLGLGLLLCSAILGSCAVGLCRLRRRRRDGRDGLPLQLGEEGSEERVEVGSRRDASVVYDGQLGLATPGRAAAHAEKRD